MNLMNSDTSSDEDEKLVRNSYIQDDSIIDESVYESSTSTTVVDEMETTKNNKVLASRSDRDSIIGLLKKKTVRILDSDDSDDPDRSVEQAISIERETLSSSSNFTKNSVERDRYSFDDSISSAEDKEENLSSSSNSSNISVEIDSVDDSISATNKGESLSGSSNFSRISVEIHRHSFDDSISATDKDGSPSVTTTSGKKSLEGSKNSTRFSKHRDNNEGNESPNSSIEILSDNDSDIIEVSSAEESPSPKKTGLKKLLKTSAARQQTLNNFVIKNEIPTPQKNKPVLRAQQSNLLQSTTTVSQTEFETQCSKVNNLETEYIKLQSWMETVNHEALPDKGKLVLERLRLAEKRYRQEKSKLDNMEVSDSKVDEAPKGAFANVAWEDIEAGANAVLPKTFGKTAMSTYNAQKAVTLDRLQQLHEALRTCPKEEDMEDDPKGIKVSLMPHQKRALAWMMFREKEKPSGGILADDMGLGKTLAMLSIIVKSMSSEETSPNKENEYIGKNTKYNGGSLIVCPASLINQWSGEIDRHLKRGLVSYYLYHGPNRETRASKLSKYDIIITTYAIVNTEANKLSALFKIKWRRLILDEAHTIRNYKVRTSEACCELLAKSRWALTGTPMHNKELDMYALLKFLRCSPFDDLQVWKRWVSDKSSGGMERLHTVISSLMLRRTKAELMEKGTLTCMPEKKWELINVTIDPDEMKIYHKVMIFSQTLFAQFLHQRAEKNQHYADQKFTDVPNNAPNQEYFKMRQRLLKLNKVKDVSQHEILVLLLRLRQICCHPSLITAMLDDSEIGLEESDEKCDQLNLLEQLEKLNIQDDDRHQPDGDAEETYGAVAQGIAQDAKITLKDASKGHLHASDPVFAKDRLSSKIKAMLDILQQRVMVKREKAIIVSQWSSYLNLLAPHLKAIGIKFDQLDGGVPVHKRMEMVNSLNDPTHEMQVLLLSLTAGGVGLNLVGANHLFLMDLHWNPQLENQAQDRIYRVGQTKPVFVYKFMAVDTIEERIKALQEKKLAMAEGLLTGTKQAIESKLSLQDLRMIFGM